MDGCIQDLWNAWSSCGHNRSQLIVKCEKNLQVSILDVANFTMMVEEESEIMTLRVILSTLFATQSLHLVTL